MWKNLFKYLLIAMFASFIAIGCGTGDDGDDGKPGATGPQGPAGESGAVLSEAESCITCHEGEGSVAFNAVDHQDSYVEETSTDFVVSITGIQSNLSFDNTTEDNVTVTLNITQNGDNFTDADLDNIIEGTDNELNLDLEYAVYDNVTNSYTAGHIGLDYDNLINVSGGEWQILIDNETNLDDQAVYGPVDNRSNNNMIFLVNGAIGPKGDYVENTFFNAIKIYGSIPSVNATTVSACESCHSDNILAHGGSPYQAKLDNASINSDDATVTYTTDSAAFFACVTCHNNGRGSYHVDFPSSTANDGASLKNTVHWDHKGFAEYPQSLSNCATCHEDQAGTTSDDLGEVLDNSNFTYYTCLSCHKSFSNFTFASYAPDHSSYDENTDCTNCHTGSGMNLQAFHSGYNDSKFMADGKAWFEYNIESLSYDNTTNELSVEWSVTNNNTGSLVNPLDTTGAIFLADPGDRDNASEGTNIILGYFGGDSNDVTHEADDVYLDTKADMLANSTYDSGTGFVTSVMTLDNLDEMSLPVKKVKVGIVGVPTVGGEMVAVRSVTQDLNLETNTEATPENAVAEANCNTCHNSIVIHTDSYHGHTTVGNPDACMVCHIPSAGAHAFEEQSRSFDSYIHAIHEGQSFFGHSVTEYPNEIANCEKCHESGEYAVPTAPSDLGAVLSHGSDNTPVEVTTGPAANACGSCHRAFAIIDPYGLGLSTYGVNAHTSEYGYRISTEVMPFADVINTLLENY